MRQKFPWLAATCIACFSLLGLAQEQPAQTTGFASGSAPVTLVLLNQSRLPDSTLADIAYSLSGKTGGVVFATRLYGIGACNPGEWCIPITDKIVGSGSDTAAAAAVGSEVTKEIIRKLVTKL